MLDNIEVMKEKLFVSFSGGRTSGFMAYYLKKTYKGEICFVFANTGKEVEATLEFIDQCDTRWNLNLNWIEYDPQKEHGKKNWFKIVDFASASRDGQPFEKFIKKERIPNPKYPNCSGRLKTLPMHNFVKHHIGWKEYKTAIGIRFDEKKRINWKSAKERNLVYPLTTEFPVDEKFIRHWWDQQEFDLNLKDYQGNCDFCWKKSDRKHVTLIREGIDLSWWQRMEQLSEYNFFRLDRSTEDLIDMSKDESIKSVGDKHENRPNDGLYDPLDIGQSCLCNF